MLLVINNAVINGVTIPIDDFVNNSAIVNYLGKDDKVTTLNHLIHWVRGTIFVDSESSLYGDYMSLENTSMLVDDDNYAVTCVLKFDSTVVMTCKAQISCRYDDDPQVTLVRLKGEANE